MERAVSASPGETRAEWAIGGVDQKRAAVRRFGVATKKPIYHVRNFPQRRMLANWIARSARNC